MFLLPTLSEASFLYIQIWIRLKIQILLEPRIFDHDFIDLYCAFDQYSRVSSYLIFLTNY